MTQDEKKTEQCLFVLIEKGKWGINEHFKKFRAIFNGAGWYIEKKYQEEVSQICQQANVRYIEFPLIDEGFEELRKRHKISFFQEKSVKARMKIDGLRHELGIQSIDITEILEGDYRENLEKTSQGKKLIELAKQYENWQEQIERIHEEEKIKNIQTTDTCIVQPYNLIDLQNDLAKTKEGLKTGFKGLDEVIRIPNAAITLIGGRPSHGKTTFMLNLFLNFIKQYPTLNFYFFSYEETRQQIAIKLINILSEYVFDEAKNILQLEGYIKSNSKGFEKVENGKKMYQELVESGRLRIIGESYDVLELSSQIFHLKDKEPVGAVFIDYIQKIKNKKRFGTRQMELQNTSEIVLETAKSCSIPIVLGAQLGRDKESKDKVKLDNLREAGDLEQDANLVLGLFNPSMEKAQDDQTQLTTRKVDLKVTPLKNRNGLVNKTITLEFDRPILSIKDK